MRPETRVILFADISESTALYRRLGDAEAHRRIRGALAQMAEAVEAHEGVVLRTVGDSTLASFSSAGDALAAAINMQQRMQHDLLSLRVGFHQGEVIPDQGDVYGDAVNLAARLADFARAGEIIASATCVEGHEFPPMARPERIDPIRVKGIDEPLALYRIGWHEDGSAGSTTIIGERFGQAAESMRRSTLELELKGTVQRIQPEQGSVLIGRADTCELQVDGEQSSRRHAQLEAREGHWMLQDLSTNGTWISKAGQGTVVLRRQGVLLDGEGALGIGGAVEDPTIEVVRYRVIN